jgi:hypothetical protein
MYLEYPNLEIQTFDITYGVKLRSVLWKAGAKEFRDGVPALIILRLVWSLE